MSLGSVLDNVVLRPLLSIYGYAFDRITDEVPNQGWAIILFALVLNFVLLPIYYQMERAGQKGPRSDPAMKAEVARMKAHYKGRERYYYIRAVFRQFRYRPISVVFSSGDLYLQVLVFATVYRFLSSRESVSGARFFVIEDLGQPDGLLWGVNALPILMTLFNVVSALLYSGDRAKRVSAFSLAALFLVLLYGRPSGLVLYWTFNNAFSLVRNLIDRKLAPLVPARLGRVLSKAVSQE